MSAALTPAEIRREFSRLEKTKQLDLLFELWDAIGPDAELSLTDADREELDQRWARYEADPASAIPWSDVQAKLEASRR